MKKTFIFLIPAIIVSSMACSLAGQVQSNPTPDLESMINATLTALANTAPSTPVFITETSVPTISLPDTGSISGGLDYPAEGVPPLRIFVFDATNPGVFYFTETALHDRTYQADNIPPGTYHVVAYTIGGDGYPVGLSGGYTKAIACGLTAECSDHSLIDVVVSAGIVTSGVDIRDWYAPDGTFPPEP
jgi:hypothetical protein